MSAFTKRPAPGCLKGSYGVEQHVHDLLSSSVGSRRRGLIDVTMKPFECGGRPVMRFYEALVGRSICNDKSVAVGRSAQQRAHRENSAATGAVFDDDRLTDPLLQMLADDTRHGVRQPPGA